MNEWRPWFAWYPVMLETGAWAWLHTVQRRWLYERWNGTTELDRTRGGYEYIARVGNTQSP